VIDGARLDENVRAAARTGHARLDHADFARSEAFVRRARNHAF
jgi:hypothetical protein